MNQNVSRVKRRYILPLWFMVVTLLGGCAANAPQQDFEKIQEKPTTSTLPGKMITGIQTVIGSETIDIKIAGNNKLTYAYVKQPLPLGIVLYFKETGVAPGVTAVLPENGIVSGIDAAELATGGQMSRIEILLKEDVPDIIVEEPDGLKVSFPRPVRSVTIGDSPTVHQNPVSAGVEAVGPEATHLQAVSAVASGQSTLITIAADGVIRDYKSFTLDDPSRIIFDLFGLKSQHKKEQLFSVESTWVKKVRHYAYPDKVRLVIDVSGKTPPRFFARSFETGLEICVGNDLPSAPANRTNISAAAVKDKSQHSGARPSAAWVNRIDFESEADGKSSILIGTTDSVEHSIKKTGERTLEVMLKNARLPDYRERPLITTRFQSAVDRILPARKSENACITIELRESVPYFVEQQDRLLLVHFEASSVPPRPLDSATAPASEDTLTKTEPTGAAKTVKVKTAPETVQEKEKPSLFAGKKYSGEKIALDFYETDIKNVFRILKEVSGKNFAIDSDVAGKVTLSFETPVPWDQVLDLILQMNQLGKIETGDIIRIATVGTLKKEDDDRQSAIAAAQKAKEQEVALEPLVTEYIPVSYANAKSEVLPHLQNILTQGRGNVSVDDRSNQIIFTDVPAKMDQAKAMVKRLDAVTPQVIIEARVVEATNNFSNELGIDWSSKQGPVQKDSLGGLYNWDVAMNFPVASASSIGFDFKRIAGTPLELNARLTAIETKGQAKIISAPKIVTLDNKKAKIKQGLQIAYLERDDTGGSSVKFKDVDLLLEVTPHVTPDQRVSMTIKLTKNDVADTVDGVPILATNEAETELLVNDGDTIVIGGILKRTNTTGKTAFPGLSGVPGLGWLFQKNSVKNDIGELLIFITPQIVQLAQR